MLKIIRAATLGTSLNTFCNGILKDLSHGVLGQSCEIIALASPDSDLQILADREGVCTIGVQMERHISPIKDFVALLKIYNVFHTEKPDMVHSMTPKAGLLCMIAAWLARVPVRVHTFTGLVWPTSTGFKRQILMLTDRITCGCATHVIPEGYGVLNDLKSHGITNKQLKVLGYGNVMGVNLAYWCRNEKLEERSKELKNYLPDGERYFTFLFVGRIVGDKGINELVKAFAMLIERKKKNGGRYICKLILVGRYEEKLDPILPETRRMIEETPEIEAVGPKFGDELKAYYAASDCFVFPSYREGFPNTVLEAGAMELPSIVTDINGSRDIVTGVSEKVKELKSERVQGLSQHLLPGETLSIRENGVMIPSKDADALYEAMLWMMDHEEERNQMGKRAREIVSERFEQSFVRKQLYDFYKEVLG